jgi:hypothetical protein
MDTKKPFYKSRTLWSGLLMLVSILYVAFVGETPPVDVVTDVPTEGVVDVVTEQGIDWTKLGATAMGMLAWVVNVFGRITATTRIGF